MFPNLKFQVLKMTLKLLAISQSHELLLNDSTLFLAHFDWGGKEGGGYESLSLWMVEDKRLWKLNPYEVFIKFRTRLR